jgi:glycosyltransferase involved in cell wall biosynthesis
MRLRLKDSPPGAPGALRPDLQAAVAAARRLEFDARRNLPAVRPGGLVGTVGLTPGRLRLCYLAPRTDVGGGARVLFEHANRLTTRGHEVTVLSHFPRPDWFDLRATFTRVPFGLELTAMVPACDVIVCGYWDQILAARTLGAAPVVHFEQGDFHLFEETLDPLIVDTAARNLSAADATITVSGTVAEVLRERYGVPAGVVHNAVDRSVFTPAGPPATADRPYVLFVGWDGNEFKGMDEMREVFAALTAAGRTLDLVWVTPRPPLAALGHVVVAPDQATLGALFRGAAAYVCCSRYESFSLPCLEAMASGTPVVATRNTGVLEYARDGENALLADVGDAEALAAQTRRILDDPALARRLSEAGLTTAAGYSWDVIIGRVEESYRAASAAWSPPPPATDWIFDTPTLAALRFADPDAEERLRRHAAVTTAGAIAVPVSFPAFDGHRAVRWRVVGRRPGGDPGTARAYLPASADEPPADLPYLAALQDFAGGRIDRALDGFMAVFGRPGAGRRAAAGRWVVLSLLELGRDVEAAELVSGAVREFPDHSDYHYLQAMVGRLTGRRVDGGAYVAAIDMLGPATRHDEWFDDPSALIRPKR